MLGKGKCSAIYLFSLIFASIIALSAQPFDVPRLLSAIQVPSGRVCITGNVAYVGGSSLSVIDVSNPSAPQLIRNLKLPFSSAGEMFVGGSRLLVEDGTLFSIYDITEPRDPKGGAMIFILQPPLSMAVIGGVYLTSDTALVSLSWPFPLAFETFDIADSLVPVSIGLTRPEDLTSFSSLFMKSAGTLSFFHHQAQTGLLTVIDCVNPRATKILSTISVSGGDSMSISDGKVFLFGPKSQVIDVSDPTKPAILDHYNLPSWPKQFKPTILNNRAYVLDGGLKTYDLTDPANPRPTGGVACRANDMALANNHAFVAAGSELLIFQIAGTPQPPALNVKQIRSDEWAIRWPGHAVDHQLYSSDDGGSSWQLMTGTPALDNGFLSIAMNVSSSINTRFFQLREKISP